MAELNQAIALAHKTENASALTSAIQAKAKIMGHDVQRSVNVNLSGTFNAMTDEELQFELASMLNEVSRCCGEASGGIAGSC